MLSNFHVCGREQLLRNYWPTPPLSDGLLIAQNIMMFITDLVYCPIYPRRVLYPLLLTEEKLSAVIYCLLKSQKEMLHPI